jgi:hypothetical protein
MIGLPETLLNHSGQVQCRIAETPARALWTIHKLIEWQVKDMPATRSISHVALTLEDQLNREFHLAPLLFVDIPTKVVGVIDIAVWSRAIHPIQHVVC